MTYKWNYLSLTEEQKGKKESLQTALKIDPALAKLLVLRNIDNRRDALRFFHPKLEDMHDPFLMPDMEKAVMRIEKALGNKERMLIYGDYDVDGTTAVSLVYKFLRSYSSNIDYYIPDRYDEGYGISFQGIDYAVETGVKLIISLDCGIKAISKIAYAKEKGIDFIVCDHHMPDDELPDAVAVVDAKRPDSIYPYPDLSGCGVGFKLVHAFSIRNNLAFSEIESLLDLVAVSIASDIVPITGENRVMMHFGLKQLNTNPSCGLKGIINICGLARKRISTSDIVFKIGPRINASGRMVNGKEAVDLLLANDPSLAAKKSVNIDKHNEDRRELDKKTTDEAIEFVEKHFDIKGQKGIVVYNENWHKGIVGIVASRLTERYFRPAVVLTKSNEMISGSARSVLGFDVYKAIESCKDILENFGGHTYAAGLSLREENFEEFKRRFEQISFDEVSAKMMMPQINVDDELTLDRLTPEFMKQLALFEPYGPENETPIFATSNVHDTGSSRLVGKDMKHIKLEIFDHTTMRTTTHAIAFGAAERFQWIQSKQPFNICYSVEENLHSGSPTIQLTIKDIERG